MNAWKNFFKALGFFSGNRSDSGSYIFYLVDYHDWLIFKLLNITFTVKVATGSWLALVFLERFIKGSRGK